MSVPESSPKYISFFLTFLLLTTFLLSLGFTFSWVPTVTCFLTITGLFCVYLLMNIPYERVYHNLGLFSNCILVLCFAIWTMLRDRYNYLLD